MNAPAPIEMPRRRTPTEKAKAILRIAGERLCVGWDKDEYTVEDLIRNTELLIELAKATAAK